jgi:hypothetical protein
VVAHGRRRKDTAVRGAGGGGRTSRRERKDVVLAIAAIVWFLSLRVVLYFLFIYYQFPFFWQIFFARVKIWARRLLVGLVQFLATGPEWTSEVQHSSHLQACNCNT